MSPSTPPAASPAASLLSLALARAEHLPLTAPERELYRAGILTVLAALDCAPVAVFADVPAGDVGEQLADAAALLSDANTVAYLALGRSAAVAAALDGHEFALHALDTARRRLGAE